MSRLSSRAFAAVGAGALTVALTMSGGVPAVAAPASGPIETMQDLKGGWLTALTGFQDGDPISWQHRMIVRKVLGSAAVAWEQWRDCADYAVACKAGKATGDGWSAPSRVLMVMDSNGVAHGVGATGTILLTPDGDGLTAVMLSHGQQGSGAATSNPTTSAQSRTKPSIDPFGNGGGGFVVGGAYAATDASPVVCAGGCDGFLVGGTYAATGPTVNAGSGAFTYTPTQIGPPIAVT